MWALALLTAAAACLAASMLPRLLAWARARACLASIPGPPAAGVMGHADIMVDPKHHEQLAAWAQLYGGVFKLRMVNKAVRAGGGRGWEGVQGAGTHSRAGRAGAAAPPAHPSRAPRAPPFFARLSLSQTRTPSPAWWSPAARRGGRWGGRCAGEGERACWHTPWAQPPANPPQPNPVRLTNRSPLCIRASTTPSTPEACLICSLHQRATPIGRRCVGVLPPPLPART